MQINFVINYTGFAGGTGTLSIHLSKYLLDKGHNVYFLYRKIDDIDNYNKLKKYGVNLLKFEKNSITDQSFIHFDSKFFFISYSFIQYIEMVMLTQSRKNITNLLYIVHPSNGIPKNKIGRLIYRYLFSSVIARMNSNGLLLLMDNYCRQSYCELYRGKTIGTDNVLLLPYAISDATSIVFEKSDDTNIRLLTIARAEFPFKGYIFGLIKQIVILSTENPTIKLQIIASGEQERDLQAEIDKIPTDFRNCVEFVGRVPYEKLADYFKSTDLYIGMGTTVLDAANHGIPALVVNSYTYESETFGYFSDNPTELAAMNGDTVHTDVFIREFIRKSPKEREALGKASYEALKAHYSDRFFLKKLFEIFEKSSSIELSLKERIGIKLLLVYYKLRGTLKGFIK